MNWKHHSDTDQTHFVDWKAGLSADGVRFQLPRLSVAICGLEDETQAFDGPGRSGKCRQCQLMHGQWVVA